MATIQQRRMIMANNQQNGNKGNNQSGDTSNRGFASMDPQKQREIAAEGGRAAHASGNAHEFNSEEARRAGSMSHKNDGNQQSGNGGGNTRGGTPEQHAEAGRQSHKNDGNQQSGGNNGGNQQSGRSTRGGTPEQHAEAGRQSHKNDKR
jgi:hypothetical protein